MNNNLTKFSLGETGMQFVNGLLFGSGFVVAAVIFKVLLKVSICG